MDLHYIKIELVDNNYLLTLFLLNIILKEDEDIIK